VTPIGATNITAPQSIVLTLTGGSGYSVGAPGTASISLPGNTVPVAATMSSGVPTFTWSSGGGVTYRVLYKNNLTDPTWLAAAPDITATGTATTWTDPHSANTTQRFYVVMLVP
jgi:hypothetical protein